MNQTKVAGMLYTGFTQHTKHKLPPQLLNQHRAPLLPSPPPPPPPTSAIRFERRRSIRDAKLELTTQIKKKNETTSKRQRNGRKLVIDSAAPATKQNKTNKPYNVALARRYGLHHPVAAADACLSLTRAQHRPPGSIPMNTYTIIKKNKRIECSL